MRQSNKNKLGTLPSTAEEWAATPRPVHLDPDKDDMLLVRKIYLLRCPFCNSKSPMPSATLNEQTGIYGYRIACSNYRCMASVFSNSDEKSKARDQAVANWQRRVTKTTDEKLSEATNLLAEHCIDNMPEGWEYTLSFSSGEASVELLDRDSVSHNEYQGNDGADVVNACEYATEKDNEAE